MDVMLEDLGRSFERSLRAADKAPGTIRLYSQAVTYFAAWLVAEGKAPTVAQFTRRNVTDWLHDLREQGQAANTRKMRYRGLNRFAKWCVAEEELPANPLDGVEAPDVKDLPPVPIIDDEHLRRLLAVCASTTWQDRRDAALFRVLLDTGVRVGELCSMRLPQDRENGPSPFDLDEQQALVTGKTGTRYVYFSDKTTQALDRYVRARRSHRHADRAELWLGERGPMTPDGVRERLNVRCEQAGLPHLHPHQFRHTWASDFLESGGQETDAMRLAGWTSDVMLRRYGSVTRDRRAKAAAQRMKRGDRV